MLSGTTTDAQSSSANAQASAWGGLEEFCARTHPRHPAAPPAPLAPLWRAWRAGPPRCSRGAGARGRACRTCRSSWRPEEKCKVRTRWDALLPSPFETRLSLDPVHLVVLDHRNLAVLAHPARKLGLRVLQRVREVVRHATRLVERPVCLRGRGSGGCAERRGACVARSGVERRANAKRRDPPVGT